MGGTVGADRCVRPKQEKVINKLRRMATQPAWFGSMFMFLMLSLSLNAIAIRPGNSFQLGMTLLTGCAICFLIFIAQMLVYLDYPKH